MPWDRNLKFEEIDKILKKEIKILATEKELNEMKGKPLLQRINLYLAYNSILFTQLQNGARISETIDAIMKFKADAKRKQMVRARKRKHKEKVKDENGKVKLDEKGNPITKIVGRDVDRLMLIPKEIKASFIDGIDGKTPKQIQNGVGLFALNHHNINTHSLRYAFISHYGFKEGVPAHLISKFIKHTNINTILNYTREQEADDTFEELIMK